MNNLYELTSDEFIRLQESGTLYKLFPKAPINVQLFEVQQKAYQAERSALELLMSIIDMSEADPFDIVVLFKTHKKALTKIVDNHDHLDWTRIRNILVDYVNEEGDDE